MMKAEDKENRKSPSESFESSLERLEKIAFSLQTETLPLQEVTDRFKEGMELAEHCRTLLDEAEKSVRSASDTLQHLTGDGRKNKNDPISDGGEESLH